MTATQAPTPGPLSGDFNVEEYVADYEFRADEGSYSPTENERALLIDAIHGALSEASLRLAPTAPVEASGSERETSDAIDLLVRSKAALQGHIDAIQAGKQASEIGQPVGHPNPILDCINGLPEIVRWLDAGQFDIEAAFEDYENRLQAALRPQPSGETREAVAFGAGKLVVDTGHYHGVPAVFICAAKVGGSVGSSAAVENNPTDCLQPNETVLTFPTMEQAKAVADALTTPARAEAQDEGAAGEPVAWLVQGEGKRDRLVNARQYNPTKPDYWISAEAMAEHTIIPLYAHPSPTPAADADRARIAVETLEATKNRVREWPIGDHDTCMCGSPVASHGMGDGHSPVSQGDHAISMIVEAINEALAALKSEGK